MNEWQRELDLKQSIQRLGENLKSLGQQAWESRESRRLQAEPAIEKAGTEFRQSGTSKRLSQDLERMRKSLKEGDMGRRLRAEWAQILSRLNREMEGWLEPDEVEGNQEVPVPGDSQ